MSLLAQLPIAHATSSAACYADAYSEFDELERPTLSFRQLRVALPQFLFEELFESGSKKSPTPSGSRSKPNQVRHQASAQFKEFVPSPHHKQQVHQQHQQQYFPVPHHLNNNQARPNRKRSDSESSSSSVDSMKVAGAHAAAVTPRTPPSPSPLRNDELGNDKYLIQCIRDLPQELRDCFTEWRRERKEAIIARDADKQRTVEKVMWNALNNIKASRKY
jgi:hypothetical protein